MSEKDSYSQVLKSSSIMGGAAGINMLIRMVRTKFAAVLIGTGGVGLLAVFMVIQNLVSVIAGLGIQSSAVRDIAAVAGKNNEQAIGRAVLTLRRICWLTGLIGGASMMLLSPYLSQWTFGTHEHALEISALGIAILLTNLSGGQMALIQGMRHIGDLARVEVIGAAIGTVIAIIFYIIMGIKGIVPALLAIAMVQLSVSWFYARRLPVPTVSMTWRESFREAGSMVRLGLAFMWTALLTSIVAYVTNALITQQISLEAVGIFAAAFALSGMFVNFVLAAMGADYFPRLTGVAPDKEAMNRMVNEQTEIGLLIAVPGLLATLSLAPWIIQLFYTSEFLPAVGLLQWFILGCLGRVVSWPLGFVMLALGKGKWFSFTETAFNLLHIALIFSALILIGIEGVAVAFFVSYIGYIILVYYVAKKLTFFCWAVSVRRLLLYNLSLIAATFVLARVLPLWPAIIIGIIATVVATVLCLRGLVRRIGEGHRLTRTAYKIPGMRMLCELSV